MASVFSKDELKNLYRPANQSSNEDNGQITIIGGSALFHGAPLLSLKVASRIVDMVFFASPEDSVGDVAEKVKSKLGSFIWVPWGDVEEYIAKSDAICIGPGFMRYGSEKKNHESHDGGCDEACQKTRLITKKLLGKYPNKKWVIDAGSLQAMDPEWIPTGAVITPNKREYEFLFKNADIESVAKRYECVIVLKGPITHICSKNKCVEVHGGNAGLTKGGTGDVLALTYSK